MEEKFAWAHGFCYSGEVTVAEMSPGSNGRNVLGSKADQETERGDCQCSSHCLLFPFI